MATAVDRKFQAHLTKSVETSQTRGSIPTMKDLRAKGIESGDAVAVCGAGPIVTCMDPRCVPEQVFGPGFGPAIRNGGGRATPDVVKSLMALRSLADLAGVIVLHHTDSQIRDEAKQRTPDAAAEVDAMVFGCVPAERYEEAIAEDVKYLRAEKLLEGVRVRGMSLEIFTGEVKEIAV